MSTVAILGWEQSDLGQHSEMQSPVAQDDSTLELRARLPRLFAERRNLWWIGEPGSGKEYWSRWLHAEAHREAVGVPWLVLSERASRKVSSSRTEALRFSKNDRESIRSALRAAAPHGTLLLRHPGRWPLPLQTTLARELKAHSGKVHCIVTSYVRPEIGVIQGTLSEDLARALRASTVLLPPLRERPLDLAPLARALGAPSESNVEEERLRAFLRRVLPTHQFPFNVSEFAAWVRLSSALLSAVSEDRAEKLLFELPGLPWAKSGYDLDLDGQFLSVRQAFEERYFSELRQRTHGNISEVSRRSGLARHQVRHHLRRFGLIPGSSSGSFD